MRFKEFISEGSGAFGRKEQPYPSIEDYVDEKLPIEPPEHKDHIDTKSSEVERPINQYLSKLFGQENDDPADRSFAKTRQVPYLPRNQWHDISPSAHELEMDKDPYQLTRSLINAIKDQHPEIWETIEKDPTITYKIIKQWIDQKGIDVVYNDLLNKSHRPQVMSRYTSNEVYPKWKQPEPKQAAPLVPSWYLKHKSPKKHPIDDTIGFDQLTSQIAKREAEVEAKKRVNITSEPAVKQNVLVEKDPFVDFAQRTPLSKDKTNQPITRKPKYVRDSTLPKWIKNCPNCGKNIAVARKICNFCGQDASWSAMR